MPRKPGQYLFPPREVKITPKFQLSYSIQVNFQYCDFFYLTLLNKQSFQLLNKAVLILTALSYLLTL